MFEEFSYTLTEPELYAALRRTQRQAGPVRLVIQTVLLGLLAVGFFVDAVRRLQGGSVLLAVVMAALAVAQWLVPAWVFRREARQLAASPHTIHLRVSEDALAVEAEEPQPLADCTLRQADDLLLWTVDRNQAVAIPRRAVSPAVWDRLVAFCD